jgi:hypothetical protein
MKTVDVRGLLCPEPVYIVREHLSSGTDPVTVLCEKHSRENLLWLGENLGWQAEVEDLFDEVRIIFRKG